MKFIPTPMKKWFGMKDYSTLKRHLAVVLGKPEIDDPKISEEEIVRIMKEAFEEKDRILNGKQKEYLGLVELAEIGRKARQELVHDVLFAEAFLGKTGEAARSEVLKAMPMAKLCDLRRDTVNQLESVFPGLFEKGIPKKKDYTDSAENELFDMVVNQTGKEANQMQKKDYTKAEDNELMEMTYGKSPTEVTSSQRKEKDYMDPANNELFQMVEKRR